METINNFLGIFCAVLLVFYVFKYIRLSEDYKILQDKKKKGELKLSETMKILIQVRENRDIVYNRHSVQIAYLKKRFLALDLALNENISGPLLKSIKLRYFENNRKTMKQLRIINK